MGGDCGSGCLDLFFGGDNDRASLGGYLDCFVLDFDAYGRFHGPAPFVSVVQFVTTSSPVEPVCTHHSTPGATASGCSMRDRRTLSDVVRVDTCTSLA